MGTEYIYANKALESAVKELKSSFFDIFYHSQGTLLMLMKQLDELEVDDEALKDEAVDLINSQGTLLSDSMSLVEELIRSIKKIDNNGKKIDKFNRSYAVNRGKNFTKIVSASISGAKVEETQTEPVTEAATEVATEVQTEPVTEAATEVATEVQTEPVTEAATEVATEVQTEPVTEAATEVATEVQTEPVTEAEMEVSTTLTGLEIDPNAPVEEETEPIIEKPKKYIADTPEAVDRDIKHALMVMPGMENLKFDSNGIPDFSSVLPNDVLEDFSKKFGFPISVKKALNKMDNDEYTESSEAVVPVEATVDLPFAVEPVIPTPAPPAPPSANSVLQSEITTEVATEVVAEFPTESVVVEVTTEAQTEAVIAPVIPGVEIAMPVEETTEAQTEVVIAPVIPGVEIAMPVEETTEVQTESVIAPVIPGVEIAMPVEETTEAQTEAVAALAIPGVEVAMPVEAPTEVQTEASVENPLAMPGVQIVMPEDAVVEGQILPFGEAIVEETTEAETVPVTEAPVEENIVRKFIDQGTNTRAMLVSDQQFNKLSGSRVTQEALLTFKKILPEKSHGSTQLVTVYANQQLNTASAVMSMDNMTAEEKNRTIEAMMTDANNLYNAGKVAEAQALYEQISEINKTLVKS